MFFSCKHDKEIVDARRDARIVMQSVVREIIQGHLNQEKPAMKRIRKTPGVQGGLKPFEMFLRNYNMSLFPSYDNIFLF